MFVISMAGLSSRFFDAGYSQPKYALRAFGQTLFCHSMRSFESYFSDTPFLFVTLGEFDAADFVRSECASLGITDARIIELDAPTRGQAETVFAGLDALGRPETPVTVFNIDTAMPGFVQPAFATDCDGYLDVFVGSGANWSYVRPASPDSDRVVETAEKQVISNLCSTGLYYFKSSGSFCDAYLQQMEAGLEGLTGGEFYVAPLYNMLIGKGQDIRYRLVPRDEVIFFGTPAEYEALLENPSSRLIRETG
jgi:hypothetical protein